MSVLRKGAHKVIWITVTVAWSWFRFCKSTTRAPGCGNVIFGVKASSTLTKVLDAAITGNFGWRNRDSHPKTAGWHEFSRSIISWKEQTRDVWGFTCLVPTCRSVRLLQVSSKLGRRASTAITQTRVQAEKRLERGDVFSSSPKITPNLIGYVTSCPNSHCVYAHSHVYWWGQPVPHCPSRCTTVCYYKAEPSLKPLAGKHVNYTWPLPTDTY